MNFLNSWIVANSRCRKKHQVVRPIAAPNPNTAANPSGLFPASDILIAKGVKDANIVDTAMYPIAERLWGGGIAAVSVMLISLAHALQLVKPFREIFCHACEQASGWLCGIISSVASGLGRASDFSSRLVELLAEGEHERLEFQQYPPPEYGSLIAEGFIYPDDMNWENYQDWLDRAGLSTTQPAEAMLRNVEVAEGSGEELAMKNAGVMFFASEPRRFCPDAVITCILFNGAERVKIIDRKDFSRGMLSDIEDSMNFIERNTRVAYEIKSLHRENIPAYPVEAVREALLNAVMHRDWYLTGANVHVEILSDRLEIKSPGSFPEGVTLATLGQAAVRRNPLVADLLGRVGLVERAGTRKLSPSASVAIALIPDAVFARISQHSTLISLILRVIGN